MSSPERAGLMTLSHLARLRPFLWLGGCTVAVMMTDSVVNLDYDQGFIGILWFGLTYLLTFVFRFVGTILGGILGVTDGPIHTALTLLGGAAVYVVADRLLLRAVKRG